MDTNTGSCSSLRIENQICFRLYSCAKEAVRQYRKPLDKLKLTYTQYIVMMVLWEFGMMTEKELGKHVHLDSGTLAPLLKRLEKLGFVNRKRAEHNERMLLISLTKQGERLRLRATEVPPEIMNRMGLSEEEFAMLRALLDKALRNMEKEA